MNTEEKTTKPLISVIMPVYNRTQYIDLAVQSILDQSYSNVELVIVDDGSEVNINDSVQKHLTSGKVKFYKKSHTGLSDSLNFGINKAEGELIAFLDDDDLWENNMLENAAKRVSEENADIVLSGYAYFSDTDQLGNIDCFRMANPKKPILPQISFNNLIPVNTVLVKKEIVLSEKGFDPEMKTAMDWDLWFRILSKHPSIAFVNECMAFIRLHDTNMSRDDHLMQLGRLTVLEKANQYLDSKTKQEINLRNKLAFRRLITGWYLAVNNIKERGREFITLAWKENVFFLALSMPILVLTFLPHPILKFLAAAAEKLSFRTNLYKRAKHEN